jgi:carbon storage regulator
MLVLSRQRDETIMIGDDVELTIVDIRGDKVRIGIKAPATVAVHRKEVYDAIRQENQQAAAFRGELGSFKPPVATRAGKTKQGRTMLPTAAKVAAGTSDRRETA